MLRVADQWVLRLGFKLLRAELLHLCSIARRQDFARHEQSARRAGRTCVGEVRVKVFVILAVVQEELAVYTPRSETDGLKTRQSCTAEARTRGPARPS